jgi:hypothetical protein
MLAGVRSSTPSIMRIVGIILVRVTFVRVTFVGAIALGGVIQACPGLAQSALSPEACRQQLDARHLTFSFTLPVAEGDCAIPLPVKLQSLAIDGTDIAFSAAPVVDCRLAERLADWIGNVVDPLARAHLGSGLAAVETGPGYACRKRNNLTSGKISEHAKGNALDIAAVTLRDGRRIAVHPTDQPGPAVIRFLTAVRTTACGYFMTVLGPGSDAAHAEHLHLDLGPSSRSPYYRICQ